MDSSWYVTVSYTFLKEYKLMLIIMHIYRLFLIHLCLSNIRHIALFLKGGSLSQRKTTTTSLSIMKIPIHCFGYWSKIIHYFWYGCMSHNPRYYLKSIFLIIYIHIKCTKYLLFRICKITFPYAFSRHSSYKCHCWTCALFCLVHDFLWQTDREQCRQRVGAYQ